MSVEPIAGEAVTAATGGVDVDVVVVVDDVESSDEATDALSVELPSIELVPAELVSEPLVEPEHPASTSMSDTLSTASSRR